MSAHALEPHAAGAHAIASSPQVRSFRDPDTATFTHVVYDADGGRAAIVDPVLDFDPVTGRLSTASADAVLAFVREHALTVDWILETHAHADHLTAAHYLKRVTGARVAIGRGITAVQARFKARLGLEPAFAIDGSQFDRLFDDGDTFSIGALEARVLATPGHTDDSVSYLVGDAAFVGDTVFGPDSGTARTDFPGGDARMLHRSIRRLFALPDTTRVFLCHDYPSSGEPRAQVPLAEQKASNAHVGGDADEDAFAAMRTARDAALAAPRLLLPALQVNLRAGALPPADVHGVRALRIPLDAADIAAVEGVA